MKLKLLTATGLSLIAGAGLTQAQQLITDFESYTAPTSGILFRTPNVSGSTSAKIQTEPLTVAEVRDTGIPAGGSTGNNALFASWNFVDSGATPLWVRFTTDAAATLSRPTIPIASGFGLQFDVWSSQPAYITANIRETETDAAILAPGGATGSIEFLGGNPNSTAVTRGVAIAANTWTTLTFEFLNPSVTPVYGFTGNGVLEPGTDGKGVLESLGLAFDDNATVRSDDINMWFDNFAIVAIPEPTAASLLGGGLLALLAFRRRS